MDNVARHLLELNELTLWYFGSISLPPRSPYPITQAITSEE